MQKEEKAHDDGINSANMRIKQAGGLEFSFQYFDETYIRKVKRMRRIQKRVLRMPATRTSTLDISIS
jgi:hypothetical protein